VRATIVASVGADGEQEAATAWLARWRPHLTYCSENQGCGCCVDIWDVDAPVEALTQLPETLQAMSEWTHPDFPRPKREHPIFRRGRRFLRMKRKGNLDR
jgi:hypothetical protein